MDLVERYLAAIARELPEKPREDIIAELRDLLLSQIEEREAELGRPLGAAETEAILQDFGHPLTVAFRYRRFQQLVGPEVFPFYLQALKVCATLAVVVQLIVFAVRLSRGETPWDAIGGLLDQLFFSLIWVVGAVTLVFTLIDHSEGAKPFRRWRPSHLPPAYVKRSRGAFEIVFDTIVDIVFIAWWTGAVTFGDKIPGPDPLTASLAPVWELFYWPVLAVPLASLAANLLVVLRPGWRRLTAGAELAASGYAAILAFVLLSAGPWVVVSGVALEPPAAAFRAQVLNTIVFWTLAGIGVVNALEALWAARRLLQAPLRLGLGAKAL
jgi:hypothetical protein